MSLDADVLIDRRSLRRKLTFWRVAAFLAVAAIIVGAALRFVTSTPTSHVARISISGLITGDRDTLDIIRRARESAGARAAIVTINSPGGTTTGSEAVYRELRELAKAKPTVAVVTGTAASGAYIAAMGTDRIISPETGIVGSIGVILQYPDFTRLLNTVGVKVEAVRSSPLKAQPNGLEPAPPEAREAITATVLDTYEWFRNLVKERRALSDAELQRVADGRVFTGRQGVPLKLVDALGSEKDAQNWLESEKSLPKGLRIVDYRRSSSLSRIGITSLAAGAAAALGFEEAAMVLAGASRQADIHALDGLLAVWQPHVQKQ